MGWCVVDAIVERERDRKLERENERERGDERERERERGVMSNLLFYGWYCNTEETDN